MVCGRACKSLAVLRLIGLPLVGRFPRATVTLREEFIEILFGGGRYERRVDVRLEHLGDIEDVEGAELRLLARLQELGYEVERGHPT